MDHHVKIQFHTLLFCLGVVMGNLEKRFDLETLEEFVLQKVKRTIPPFTGKDTFINVSLEYAPLAILDLDSANEILSVSSFCQVKWQDEILTWNPANYSQHRLVEVDPQQIWTPKITLSSSVTGLQTLESRYSVLVYNTGTLRWHLSDIFHTRCTLDVEYYPFDTQKCEVTFVPAFGYGINFKLQIQSLSEHGNVVPKNGEWTLESTSYSMFQVDDMNTTAGQFTLTIRRKSLYYIINIVFPMTLLSILNPVVFLIPVRSGEKLGFLMSVFVSHAVFLNLIHQSMPPTSDVISTLAMFLVLIEIQCFITILATISVLCFHHRNEKTKEETKQHEHRKDKADKDQEVIQDIAKLVEIKSGGRVRGLCRNVPIERFLDWLFFMLCISITFFGYVALWMKSY